MRVGFMLIGAQKSGTTSLAAQLAEHPDICFSRVKEPAFFSESENWRSELGRYHELFEVEHPRQLCGEASTMYTFLPEWPHTCERLYAYNAELKLIYMMRNPVERAISHYAHNFVRGFETRSPERAVIEDARYLNRSRYGVQLRPYLELFGRNQILLLVFEEYVGNQFATLAQIADFLGISADPFSSVDTTPKHKTVGEAYLRNEAVAAFTQTGLFRSIKAVVPESIRQPIRRRFFSNSLEAKPVFDQGLKEIMGCFLADDVAAIEKLLSRSLTSWKPEVEL